MSHYFEEPREWSGPSRDPNDEQFGDIIDPISLTDADDYELAIVGEPYDGGHIVGRPGARKGPDILRKALAGTKTHHLDNGPVKQLGDLGDIRYPMGQSVSEAQRAFVEITRQVHETSLTPVFFGGDHSLAYSNVMPLLEQHESVGVINLDSHTDVREFIDGQPHTGTPFRQLIEAGLDRYVQLGARQFGLSTPYVEYAREQNATIVTAEQIGRNLDQPIETALEAMNDVDAIYISFDVDVLDTIAAPGTSSTEPGGLLSREVNQIIRALAMDSRIAGFGVYEFSPMLDAEDRTAIAGARAVAHFLSGFQQR
jgi:formiminoglutamase/agmatinase